MNQLQGIDKKYPIFVSLNLVCPMPSVKSFCISPFLSWRVSSMIASVFSIASSTVDRISAIFCCSDNDGYKISYEVISVLFTAVNVLPCSNRSNLGIELFI